MATTLYCRVLAPSLWGTGATRGFSLKDASRAITPGRLTFNGQFVLDALSTTIGTGTGQAEVANTTAGPTAGEYLGIFGFFSDPLDQDVTISGTITFRFCSNESNMNANTTWRAVVYRVDAEGALTLIVDSALGTELSTSLTRNTWTATPTSTNMKKGDRIFLFPIADDATGVNMGSGHTITFQHNGSNANTADSNIEFTETFGFLTTNPSTTTYYLRNTASDLGGIEKALSTTQGSGTQTVVHTTLAGPTAFPGDLWTLTAGGSDVSWTTPTLNAFTLGGAVLVHIGKESGHVLEHLSVTPFDCFTVELAVVNSDGSNASVWARSYTSQSESAAATLSVYLTGPDKSVAQGQRLRLRIYSDDYLPGASGTASGTDKTIRYDGTSTYASRIIFSQTITEGAGFTPRARARVIST